MADRVIGGGGLLYWKTLPVETAEDGNGRTRLRVRDDLMVNELARSSPPVSSGAGVRGEDVPDNSCCNTLGATKSRTMTLASSSAMGVSGLRSGTT